MENKNAILGKQSRTWFVTLRYFVKDSDGNILDTNTKEKVLHEFRNYRFKGQLEIGNGSSEKNPDGYAHWQLLIWNRNGAAIRAKQLINKFPGIELSLPENIFAVQNYVLKTETAAGLDDAGNPVKVAEHPDVVPLVLENGDWSGTQIPSGEAALRIVMDEFEQGKTGSEVIVAHPELGFHAQKIKTWEELKLKGENAKWGRVIRDKPRVVYISGESGVGKTTFVYKQFTEQKVVKNLYTITDYKNPFDFYQNESACLFDEFVGAQQIEAEYLLKLLQGFPVELRRRYFNLYAGWDTVYFCSNLPFEEMLNTYKCPRQQIRAIDNRFSEIYEMNKNHELNRIR